MKKVLITGGTRGIGRAIAELFFGDGYTVGVTYARSEKIAREMKREFPGVFVFESDFSDPRAASDLASAVISEMGAPDVLINNAGVSSYGLFQDVSPEEYRRVFQINFDSMFFLTQALIAPMISQKWGRIINLSSVWGQTGASCEVLYSATKAAMIGFTKALAKEVAPSGITVNAIAPGVVDTDMMKSFSTEEKEELKKEIPTGSFTSPWEIAKIAKLLCEDGLSSFTGQVLGVNGGMYL